MSSEPFVQVIRGNPDDSELAALIAVLVLLGGDSDATPAPPRNWNSRPGKAWRRAPGTWWTSGCPT